MMSSVTESHAGNELIIEKKIISRLYKRFLLIQAGSGGQEPSGEDVNNSQDACQRLQGPGTEPTNLVH